MYYYSVVLLSCINLLCEDILSEMLYNRSVSSKVFSHTQNFILTLETVFSALASIHPCCLDKELSNSYTWLLTHELFLLHMVG